MAMRYAHAVLRDVSSNVAAGQSLEKGTGPSYAAVKADWDSYWSHLCAILGPANVHKLEADDGLPDCMFIEDTMIVAGNTVLFTQLGHPTRRAESRAVRDLVRSHFAPRFNLVNMVEKDPIAYMDGGDVLFTGREFFVGQSERTNMRALKVLQSAFPDYPVHPVTVKGALHLKSMVTLAAPDRLVAHDSEAGHACVHTISSISSHQYGVIYVPDAAAANVVHVNGVLFVPADCPRSKAILTEALVNVPNPPVHTIIDLDCAEARKIDGAISCTAVFFPKLDESE